MTSTILAAKTKKKREKSGISVGPLKRHFSVFQNLKVTRSVLARARRNKHILQQEITCFCVLEIPR